MQKLNTDKVVYYVYYNNYTKPKIYIGVIDYVDEYDNVNIVNLKPFEILLVNGVLVENFKDEYTIRPKNAKLLESDNGIYKHKVKTISPYAEIVKNIDIKNLKEIQSVYDKKMIVKRKFDYKISDDWNFKFWKVKVEKRFVDSHTTSSKYVFLDYNKALEFCNSVNVERNRYSSLTEEEQCKEDIIKYLSSYFAEKELGIISDKLFDLGDIENLEVKVERYGDDFLQQRVLYKWFTPSIGIKPLKPTPKWCGSMKKHRENVKVANKESVIRSRKLWNELVV